MTVKAHKKPLFLDPNQFLDKDAYIRLMGYDKPLEWELPEQENSEHDNNKK